MLLDTFPLNGRLCISSIVLQFELYYSVPYFVLEYIQFVSSSCVLNIPGNTLFASAGCCFIKYATPEEADRAIHALHNQYTLPGVSIDYFLSFNTLP